jgi:hypothetical protein
MWHQAAALVDRLAGDEKRLDVTCGQAFVRLQNYIEKSLRLLQIL